MGLLLPEVLPGNWFANAAAYAYRIARFGRV
jgi:hypothetical protein